ARCEDSQWRGTGERTGWQTSGIEGVAAAERSRKSGSAGGAEALRRARLRSGCLPDVAANGDGPAEVDENCGRRSRCRTVFQSFGRAALRGIVRGRKIGRVTG